MWKSTLIFALSVICFVGAEDVRLVDLDPPEAQQLIDSKDTTLKYAPKIESNVPAVRYIGNEPQNVQEDIYLANQYHGQDGLGGYLYGYSVPDIAKTERKKAGGDLRGAYNYISGDGQEIKVEYWDDGNGFHQVDNVPKILPKQIEDSPDVKAAKDEHARIWAEEAERNSKPIQNPYPNAQPGAYAGLGAGVGAGVPNPKPQGQFGGQGQHNQGGYQGQQGQQGGFNQQGQASHHGGQGQAQQGFGQQRPQGGYQQQGQAGHQNQGAQGQSQQGFGQQRPQGGHQGQQSQQGSYNQPGHQQNQGQGNYGSNQAARPQGQGFGGQGQQSQQGQNYGGQGQNPHGGYQGQQSQHNQGFGQNNQQRPQQGFGGQQSQGQYGSQQTNQQRPQFGNQGQNQPQHQQGAYNKPAQNQYGGSGGSHDYSGQQTQNQNQYAKNPNQQDGEDDGAYKSDDSEGQWKDDTNEPTGPPKGFFYNVDYPVGIIVSKQGGAVQGSNVGDTYKQNKANFEQQLQGGAAVHGAGSYPSYQVHS